MPRVLDYNATLARRQEISEGLDVFHVELDEPLEPKPDIGAPFVPGQYVTIGLNKPDEAEDPALPASVLRPMTIVSSPRSDSTLEFFVRYVQKPDARLPLTHLMWDLSPGDRMFVRPSATGHFTLPDMVADTERSVVMIAGGTGLAPFMSILRHECEAHPEGSLARFGVLYGVSNPDCLGYHEELETWARDRGLGYLPTVARPHEASGWGGSLGKLSSILQPDAIESTEATLGLELDPARTTVLVCGLGRTIAGTIRALLPRGYLPEHRRLKSILGARESPSTLFFEQYDTATLFDFKDEGVVEALRELWAPSSPSSASSG